MGVKVSEISENEEGSLTITVLDSFGDEYLVQLERESGHLYSLRRIVLPDDEWNVDVFQEVIEVREEALEEVLENEEFEVELLQECMTLGQIYTYSAAQAS